MKISSDNNSLLVLQNGSDIRGIAMEGVAGETINLSSQQSSDLGKAFSVWLSRSFSKPLNTLKIAVGMDSRISGTVLKKAFIEGSSNLGCTLYDVGLATTPALFMATQFDELKCDGAVMITASHLPFNRNGYKLFTSLSGLEKPDITLLLEMAIKKDWPTASGSGKIYSYDLIGRYSEFICQHIRYHTQQSQPLQGLKILVDAGNGAGGFFVEQILMRLGADTLGSLFLEPDGMFPNHIPNPEDATAISYLQKAVTDHKADLGIIFDTDVDRAALVDNTGKPINRNRLIALMSAIVLEEHPESTIVTDSVTSDGLGIFISELGGKHRRFCRGYRNVINESKRLNALGEESWLAIETSGHAAFRENYFLDDGAFLVAKILVRYAKLRSEDKQLSELLSGLKEPLEECEIRIKIKGNDFKTDGQKVLKQLEKFVLTQLGWTIEPENYEGIRVRCNKKNGDGWFLLRLSLHEPILPLNIESVEVGGVDKILNRLRPFLNDYNFLSLT